MFKSGELWIRNNRNVKVVLWGFNKTTNEILFLYKGNGHRGRMNANRFLVEFVALEPLLREIAKDSEWISIKHGFEARVTQVSKNGGFVEYMNPDWPEHNYFRVAIGSFKNEFSKKEAL